MGTTVRNCKALLRKGGLLIANELTTKTAFLTLTFGLTDGWWLFDDKDRRIPGSPMLSRHASCQCLFVSSSTHDAKSCSRAQFQPSPLNICCPWNKYEEALEGSAAQALCRCRINCSGAQKRPTSQR